MRRVERTGSQTAWRVAMDRVGIGQRETKSTRMNEGRSENGLWLLGSERHANEWRDKQAVACLSARQCFGYLYIESGW